jgi:UPF0755 protein
MKKSLYVLLILSIVSFIFVLFVPSYLSVASNDEPMEITVPQGAALNHVSNLLFDKGIIKSKIWFNYKAKQDAVDRSIKPGTYVFSPHITLEEIFEILLKGTAETPVILTIPEGFTLYQIAQRVESLGFGTLEDFIETTKEYGESKEYAFNEENLYYIMEGYLYPDTYYFTQNQTLWEVVDRLAKQMESIITEEYNNRAEALGLTTHEVLTIASLIEREAYNDNEKNTISGVIHNRLKINMPLQIDATVIYGRGKGKEHISQVLHSHLQEENPFNTYMVRGLPPGPIASPRKTSIQAALYPEEHNYLYYVLGENGHIFSKTYEEHLRNVANYRRTINQN